MSFTAYQMKTLVAQKDRGKNYIKVRLILVLHLLHNRLLRSERMAAPNLEISDLALVSDLLSERNIAPHASYTALKKLMTVSSTCP